MRSRQCKVLSIDDDYVCGFLRFSLDETLKLSVPVIPELPLDYEVLGYERNFRRQCLDVLIWSNTFEDIPHGYEFPRIDIEYVGRKFVVATEEKN